MNADEPMKSVFLMWYVRMDDEYSDDAMLIGVYRKRSDCEEAIARLKDKSGFRDYPSGFQIDEYPLNKDHWTEGFISVEEAHKAFETDPNL